MNKLLAVFFLFLVSTPVLANKDIHKGDHSRLIADGTGLMVLIYEAKSEDGKLEQQRVVAGVKTLPAKIEKLKIPQKEKNEILISLKKYEKNMYKDVVTFWEGVSTEVEEVNKPLALDNCIRQDKVETEAPKSKQYNYYDIEMSPELLAHIDAYKGDKSFLGMGKKTAQAISISLGNDNVLHGGGRALGLISDKNDGDDHGKTFSGFLKHMSEFEGGSFSVDFFSKLYSSWAVKDDKFGPQRYLNNLGHYYQTALSVEGIGAELVKKGSDGKSFFRFRVEVGREKDQDGLGAKIQSAYHDIIKDRFENVPVYENLEHREDKLFLNTKLGVGQNYTLYKNGKVKVEASAEMGANLSTNKNHNSLYAGGRVEASIGRFGTSVSAEIDTNRNYNVRNSVYYKIYNSETSELRLMSSFDYFVDPYTNPSEQIHYKGESKLHHTIGVEFKKKF